MLYYGTVKAGTLQVLKNLMTIDELKDFYLVGGTELSLLYGHRISFDLDLFSVKMFSNEDIIPILEKKIKGFTYRNINNPVGIFSMVEDVKVDFVQHHYHPLIDAPLFEDTIRMFSAREIMARKVSAILRRAVKKDFWDIA